MNKRDGFSDPRLTVDGRLDRIEEKLDLLLQARPGKRRYLCDKGHWHAVWGPMSLGETVFACVPETIDE